MTVCTVYGDLLFFTDFLMDLALFFAVSRFGNFKTPFFFLIAAAFCGGIYSLLSVFPFLSFLRLWYWKAAVSVLLVKLAFPYLKGMRFGTAFLYFYLIGFAMAGAVVCLSWFFREQGWANVGFSYTAMGLSAGLLLVLFLSRRGKSYIRRNLRVNETTEVIDIWLNGKKAELTALFDTGNELVDPVTRLPVVIVEYEAVKPLLPACFCEIYERCEPEGADAVLKAMGSYAIASRLRLIPFSSLGRSHGMMLGLKPDRICFPARKKKKAEDVVICFYRGAMHTKEHCRCIVNPAILDEI